jgi:hypothetical protein
MEEMRDKEAISHTENNTVIKEFIPVSNYIKYNIPF